MKKIVTILFIFLALNACAHERWVYSQDPDRPVLDPPCPAFDMYQLNNQNRCVPVVMNTQRVSGVKVKEPLATILNGLRRWTRFPDYSRGVTR